MQLIRLRLTRALLAVGLILTLLLSAGTLAGAQGAGPGPDIDLSMSVSDLTPVMGDEVVYSVTVANIGDALATELVVEDTLVDALTLSRVTAADGQVSFDDPNRQLRWNVGELGPGESATLTYATIIGGSAGEAIVNSATAVIAEEEAATANNTAGTEVSTPGSIDDPGAKQAVEASSRPDQTSPSESAGTTVETTDLGSEISADPAQGLASIDAPDQASPKPDATNLVDETTNDEGEQVETPTTAQAPTPLGEPPASLAFAGSRSEHVATISLMSVMAGLVAVATMRNRPKARPLSVLKQRQRAASTPMPS